MQVPEAVLRSAPAAMAVVAAEREAEEGVKEFG
jgi:hypothetical protein